MEESKKFVDGIWIKEAENAPDFVKFNVLIDYQEFMDSIGQEVDMEGKVQMDIKKSQSGNLYAEIDDYNA